MENILKPKGMLCNVNLTYRQLFGIWCEHCYDCSHKDQCLAPTYFPYFLTSLLYMENWEV